MTNPEKPADFIVDNASGSAVREDLNDIFGAIRSNNGEYSGEPTTRYKYMWYADSGADKMSFYKSDAQTKIGFISLDNGNFFGPTGTATVPSYTFTGDASTGFFNLNTGSTLNQIRVANNGQVTAIFEPQLVGINGNVNIQKPNADTILQVSSPTAGRIAALDLMADDITYTDFGLRVGRDYGENAKSFLEHRGTAAFEIKTTEASSIEFTTQNLSKFRITAAGAFQPIGTSFNNANNSIGAVAARGFVMRNGADFDNLGTTSTSDDIASASTGNLFNFWWDSNDAYFYVDNTRLGHIDASTTSDYRIKREITTLAVNAIERIKRLRPVTFKYRDYDIYKQSEAVHEGFVAHEVGEVIPDACKGNKDERLQIIGIAPIVANLTKALQEAVAKIETLEAKVAVLEGS